MALSDLEREPAHFAEEDSSVQIRHYNAADYPALFALWVSSGLRPFTRQNVERLLASQGQVLVAEKIDAAESQIIGTLSWSHNGEQAFLWRVAVAEPFRGQGVAKALLRFAEAEIRDAGFVGMGLLTREVNHAAKSLYHGQGWNYRPEMEYWNKRLVQNDETKHTVDGK